MKEFSLEEYLKNPERKIVTRDGRPVRIICTDRKGLSAKPIVGLITEPNNDEVILTYWENGIEKRGSEYKNDLFFVPTKHERWINLYKFRGCLTDCEVFNTAEEAKKIAAEDEDYITTIKVEWEE